MFDITKQVTTEDYKSGTLVKIKPKDSPDWHRSTLDSPVRRCHMFNVLGRVICGIPGSCNDAYLVEHQGLRAGYWVDEMIICVDRSIVG